MTTTFAKLKTLLCLAVGFFAALGVLSVTQGHPAQASTSPGVNLAALLAKVNAQASQIAALQAKTAALTQSGTPGTSGATLQVSGVNVQIVSGSGSTNDNTIGSDGNPIAGASLTGLGNLIIGYNQSRGGSDIRTGSHNLILGDQNNYSSYGGLVAGAGNTISKYYATVTGGLFNTASGEFASVSGGFESTASGQYASVSGGYQNSASNYYASVSGGQNNAASGLYASVSGGVGNHASAQYASVSGGNSITQNTVEGWSAGSQGSTAYSGRFTSP